MSHLSINQDVSSLSEARELGDKVAKDSAMALLVVIDNFFDEQRR
jgi:hypothetical protein